MTNQIKPTNKIIKSLARQMFTGYYFEAVVVLVMVELIALVPGRIIGFFFSSSTIMAYIADVYTMMIRGPLTFASAIYFLCNFRNQRVRYNCLMYGFDYFIKAAAIYIFTFILTMAGFVLCLVPGFIAMINFSQAMNILVDHPDKQPLQCMRDSKLMMKGYRMKYVSFAISYWIPFILSRLPQVLLSIPAYKELSFDALLRDPNLMLVAQNQVFNNPLYILCQLAMVSCSAYFGMGKAAFYDIIAGNLIFANEEQEERQEIEIINSEDSE